MLIEIERYTDFRNLEDLHKTAQTLISNTNYEN
jgi:hypothetical protein